MFSTFFFSLSHKSYDKKKQKTKIIFTKLVKKIWNTSSLNKKMI